LENENAKKKIIIIRCDNKNGLSQITIVTQYPISGKIRIVLFYWRNL